MNEDLRSLALAYAAAVDGGDADAFVELFCDDAVLVVERPDRETSEVRGRDRLRRIPGALARYDRTEHLVGAATYDRRSATRATGAVECVAHHVARGVDTVMTIRYADDYELVGDRWRIARRVVRVLAVTDEPAP